MTDSRTLTWLDFEPATLQRAKAANQLVLLVLTVPWCKHCKSLLQTTFRDSQVTRSIREHFVPALVDAERRPDVNERYGTGSWPTIAFLTPDGELLASEHYLSPPELQVRLDRVRMVWREHRNDIYKGLQELWSHKTEGRSSRGRLTREMVDDVTDAIYEKFDHRYGGWGDGAKFAHPDAL